MSFPLISTKFNIPSVGARHVHRTRLTRMLDESLDHPASLTLVCGPAGYGKTMLVSDWLQTVTRDKSQRLAWLTLEPTDNELARFLTYFVTALQQVHSNIGQGMLKLLQTHKPSPVQALASILVNDLCEVKERFLLVLDDFHVISAKPINELISFLVDHQPPQMNLILVTRADPSLPLARLRIRNRLVEIRQSDLRFQSGEITEFINQVMELALAPEQLALLGQRTEGWIAGLQLAALSMRAMRDKSVFLQAFSGEHAFISDYLTDEVLAQLPQHLRQFLLQTSILERLTASLCEAVTQQGGAQAILEELSNQNLFIFPLDTQREWYRYHTLFSDLLRKRLQDVASAEIHELHRRAACWHREHGQRESAVEHYLSGQDHESAAALIEQVSDRYLMYGDSPTLLRWLETLPKTVILRHPALGVLKGFALVLCNRPPQEISSMLQDMEAAGDLDGYQGEMKTLRSLLAVLQGQVSDAISLSEQALAQLPQERSFFRSLAADSLGMAYTLAGDLASASPAFEQVVRFSTQSDNIMMTIAALTNLAGLRYMQGQLRAAIATCRQVLDLVDRQIGRHTPMLGKTLFSLGEMLREQGDLQRAQDYLVEAARLMENFQEFGLPLVWLALARIKVCTNDWPTAQEYIHKARQGAQATQTTQLDDRLVDIMQARLWLARGQLEQVIQWAKGQGLLERSLAEDLAGAGLNASLNEVVQAEYLLLVRLTLAQDQAGKAVEMLTLLQDYNVAKGYQRRVIETLVLKSLAQQQKGDLEQALETLGSALKLAQPEGYRRIFIDEGQPMAQLLYQAAARDISVKYAGELLKDFSDQNPAAASQEESKQPGLIEPLSKRELEVLALIARGLSNGEIAAQMYISLSTVKGHATKIFNKLNVANRTQAVSRARQIGLLSKD